MGVKITFDYSKWIVSYPEFTKTASQPQAEGFFAQATLYCRNDGGGPVTTAEIQTQLLWLLTAHIAQLMVGSSGQPVSPLVGRISNASEGSVSVQTDYPATTPNSAWFTQTKYGASYWQATAIYRTMRYRPNTGRPVVGAGPWWGY